ncbi:hypothetical protein L798_06568 [Zootermopsis nevadensis]|uniref:Uncharacterized protein n=1 Tax=Zootermopsis nevadensis TaxID=136037 RepID=A0A067RHG9_ZOONE|nr:hypothetical protein L798_06568 [Zootermopsis nevadensis]
MAAMEWTSPEPVMEAPHPLSPRVPEATQTAFPVLPGPLSHHSALFRAHPAQASAHFHSPDSSSSPPTFRMTGDPLVGLRGALKRAAFSDRSPFFSPSLSLTLRHAPSSYWFPCPRLILTPIPTG